VVRALGARLASAPGACLWRPASLTLTSIGARLPRALLLQEEDVQARRQQRQRGDDAGLQHRGEGS
jgi:hypothetical protein